MAAWDMRQCVQRQVLALGRIGQGLLLARAAKVEHQPVRRETRPELAEMGSEFRSLMPFAFLFSRDEARLGRSRSLGI